MKYLLIMTLALFFIGCKADNTQGDGAMASLQISGVVQNGPFRQYTQGKIQGLDASFNQVVGEYITVETADILGSYASQVAFPTSVYAKVTFTGQYFNENTGAYSLGDLTTSSYVFGVSDSNVNLVTHIIQDYFVVLKNSGQTENEAFLNATKKFMLEATGETVTTGANSWLISDASPLLFISVLLQHQVEGASLQNRINAIRSAFASGTLSQSTKDLLKSNATQIIEAPIHAGILSGLGITTQSFSARLEALDPSRTIASKHVQGVGATTFAPGGQGQSTKFYVPFTLAQQTQIKYLSLPCAAANISIHDTNGTLTGIRDDALQPVLSANVGNILGSATYTKDALPLRDYGNGIIKTDQATFATALDLAAGDYWLSLDLASGCIVNTYEPVTHGLTIFKSGVDLFSYPLSTLGTNSIHFEIL
jgi:hypothetical protein